MKKLGMFLILSAFILLVACNNGAESGVEADEQENVETTEVDDELRIATESVPPTLDAHFSSAASTIEVAINIFEQLFAFDSEFNPTPFLAEDYELSSDGRELTIYLREGIKFHNGKEMTAEDVIASIERWTELSTTGRSAFQDLTDIVEEDKYTVHLEFSDPSGVRLNAMSYHVQPLVVMPKEVIDDSEEETGVKEYIGTGPYKFVEWKTDQHIHLTRNDEYQPQETETDGFIGKRTAHFKDLYFLPTPDEATRLLGLQSGEYDYAFGIEPDNYERVQEDDEILPLIQEYRYLLTLILNHEGILSNEKLREAVNTALDMYEINYAAFGSEEFFELDGGLVFPFQDLYVEDGLELYNQNNLEKAKQLLQEAGYDGTPVTFFATRDYEYNYRIVNVISERLEEIGMNVEIEVYDWATHTSIRRSEKDSWDMFITRFSVQSDPTLTMFLDPRNEYEGGYSSPEMEELLDEMRAEIDPNKSKEIFKEIQKRLWEELPGIILGKNHTLSAYNNNLEVPEPFVTQTLYNVKWKD